MLILSDYISIISPRFQRFNVVIGEMCNEARRNILQVNPSAVFEIDGSLHKKLTNNKLILNNAIITPCSSRRLSQNNDIYQESVNISNAYVESFSSKCFDYITKSNNILENLLVESIDESSQEAPF